MTNSSDPIQGSRKISVRIVFLLLSLITVSILSGCASFNNNMGDFPGRTGAPPYADDPEANGNPDKAWYN